MKSVNWTGGIAGHNGVKSVSKYVRTTFILVYPPDEFLFQKEIVNFAAYLFYNGVAQITGTYTLTDNYVADIRGGGGEDKDDTTPQYG